MTATPKASALPALAVLVRQEVPSASGAEELAQRLEPVLAAEAPRLRTIWADRIKLRLLESYARAGGVGVVDPAQARKNCLTIADEMLREEGFSAKLSRWVSVNVCFWLWEGDALTSVDGESLGALIGVYAESSAQILGEMTAPPNKPITYLEEILGIRPAAGPATAGAELPPGMLMVLSARHFQELREVLAKNSFRRRDGTPWPTASMGRAGDASFAQLRPPEADDLPALPPDRLQAWADTMWRQQSDLSDRDADALDALCALYLAQARGPDDAAVADIDQLLDLRGLQPKRGGGGRRGGYEPEQREEMVKALSHIQSLWITLADVEFTDTDPQRRKTGGGREPARMSLQSRPFLITDRMGRRRADGGIDLERFIFRPGKAFSAFLFGNGRHLLFRKALQYDPYRRRWEKRLTRYFCWHWGAGGQGQVFLQSHSVQSLLEVAGQEVDGAHPSKTRSRFEKALDLLRNDQVIADWHYASSPGSLRDRRWVAAWLATHVVIDAPPPIKKFYGPVDEAPLALTEPGDLAAQLRQRRKSLGLTQLELANCLGIRQGHLSKLESGKVMASSSLRTILQTWLADHG